MQHEVKLLSISATIFPRKLFISPQVLRLHTKMLKGKLCMKTSHASIKTRSSRLYSCIHRHDKTRSFPTSSKLAPQTFQKLKVISRFTITSPKPNGEIDPSGSMMHDAMPVDIQKLRELVYMNVIQKCRSCDSRIKPFDQLAKFIEQHKLTNIDKFS